MRKACAETLFHIRRQLMSHETLEQFRQLVLDDMALQERLRAVPVRAEFITLTLQLGAERGYDFTVDDIEDVLRANQRAWLERWLEV
jgi:hypothetical protein